MQVSTGVEGSVIVAQAASVSASVRTSRVTRTRVRARRAVTATVLGVPPVERPDATDGAR